jgi:3-deoxy-manno-octulosonate cytidylyltransferase (CMP-KDO synthetase)
MASLMTTLRPDDLANPNVVKVVVDRDGYALYFSRAPIPYVRTDQGSSRFKVQGPRQEPLPPASSLQPRACYKHIGIYGYQRHFLLQFPSLEPTPLEQSEQLEQLRALEHGYKIKLLETVHDSIGVDTPGDLARVETLMAKSSGKLKVES